MDDIRRPSPSEQQITPEPVAPPSAPPAFSLQPLTEPSAPLMPQKPRHKRVWLWVTLALVGIIVAVIAAAVIWYQHQLSPVTPSATERIQVTIATGTSPAGIARQLKDEELIKSTDAFALYVRLSGTRNALQAGSYHLSPSESVPEIVDHLVGGRVDSFDITFLPGATLAQNREVLISAGYSEAEVDEGLRAQYDSMLFEGKPANADLEGYIYGETYRVSNGASVADILQQSFKQYEKVLIENGLVAGFTGRGLSTYQAITLASIIQRESIGGDEAQIAQVFYTRLGMDMELGSDVTYQYIADKTGVARDPNLDSPYNTRRYPGLPPGPIAAPGLASLKAVAAPAEGDFVYFLSGDDDVTYFARTFEEHEANISNHCQQKCLIL
jgi:UPF0755 protein